MDPGRTYVVRWSCCLAAALAGTTTLFTTKTLSVTVSAKADDLHDTLLVYATNRPCATRYQAAIDQTMTIQQTTGESASWPTSIPAPTRARRERAPNGPLRLPLHGGQSTGGARNEDGVRDAVRLTRRPALSGKLAQHPGRPRLADGKGADQIGPSAQVGPVRQRCGSPAGISPRTSPSA